MRSTPCSVCGETLKCGTGTGSCWCKSFPPIMPLDFDQDCRCPACLSKAVDKQIDVLIKENGIKQMLQLAEPYRNKSEAIEYIAPEKGGHMGYIEKSKNGSGDRRWMDRFVLNWAEESEK